MFASSAATSSLFLPCHHQRLQLAKVPRAQQRQRGFHVQSLLSNAPKTEELLRAAKK